ncbi:ABC transporter substrate-binding protein [Oceanibaculum pacificum]|uniref:Nitrate ABC transporter substrate-binding protein n=1 Tax=Oceanibaculum pacificum TaxID=580166 RepID=A0A154W1S5_9PROT|nr:ABC transporter substrate-binding protein [Oceanibaculum pacificum]KZD07413.1 hypothetical protein AUP43_02515 [Oceanibaculum pacificum]
MRTLLSRSRRAILAGLVAVTAATLFAAPSHAEGTIRIVEQFGISYLPFHVIRDQDLLKKHGAAQGIEIKTEWQRVSGGAAANDALLSGSVDIVSAGVGPLLTIWDRTKGRADVKGIAAGIAAPFYLVSNNPKVKTLADFTEADKIALPSVTVSVQARTLQIAAAKAFGKDKFDALDKLTVSLPHPDATQALLSGSGTITGYFSSAPFQYQVLKDPKIHKVLDSYEVLGGPATSVTIYTTAKYREENPKTYKAFLAALDEASRWIHANHDAAADTYIRVTGSKLDKALILSIVSDPQISFDPTPLRTEIYADFLHEIGAIKNKASSWKDYFFPDIHDRTGS